MEELSKMTKARGHLRTKTRDRSAPVPRSGRVMKDGKTKHLYHGINAEYCRLLIGWGLRRDAARMIEMDWGQDDVRYGTGTIDPESVETIIEGGVEFNLYADGEAE